MIAIHRARWASVADTCNFFNELDEIVSKEVNIVFMEDFNMPGAETISTGISQCGNLKKLQAFMDNNLLTQINNMPSRKDNFLDLVFVSNRFAMSRVSQQLPIGEFDHFAQRVNLNVHLNANTSNDNSALRPDLISTIDYLQCAEILRTVNWSCAFHSCRDVNDFLSVFTSEFDAAITESTVLKTLTVRKRQCLPRYILKLIRKKTAERSKAKDAVDKTAYCKARNALRTSLVAWRAEKEKQLINGRNKSRFYRFINERLGKRSSLQSLIYLITLELNKERRWQRFLVLSFHPVFLKMLMCL